MVEIAVVVGARASAAVEDAVDVVEDAVRVVAVEGGRRMPADAETAGAGGGRGDGTVDGTGRC